MGVSGPIAAFWKRLTDARTATTAVGSPAIWWALVFLAAPLLLEQTSIIAMPAPLGRHVAKATEAFAIGMIVLCMIRERWLPRLSLPVGLAMLYVGHAWISGMWAPYAPWFDTHFAKLIHHASVAVVLFVAIRTRRDLDRAICGLHIVAAITGLLVMVELADPGFRIDRLIVGEEFMEVNYDTFEGIGGGYYRAKGPLGHANFLGFFFGAALLVQPYLWTRFPSWGARAVLVVITLVELWALVRGYVRLGVLGLAAGSVWLLLRGAIKHRLLVVLAVLAVIPLAIPVLPLGWLTRTLDPTHLTQSKSIQYRTSQMVETFKLAKRYGGFGVGYSGYGSVFHREAAGDAVETSIAMAGFFGTVYNPNNLGAHNTYLEILIEQGVIGLGLFLGVWITLGLGLLRTRRRCRGDPLASELGLVFEAMMVSIAVMYATLHAQDQRIPWIVVGVGSAYVSLARAGKLDEPPLQRLFSRSAARRGLTLLFGVFVVVSLLGRAQWLAVPFLVLLLGARHLFRAR